MSNLLSRAPLRDPFHYLGLPLPADEAETWSREELERMDAAFSAALEQAFAAGLESRESAAGQVNLRPSLGPRWVTPLTREIREGLWRSSAANALVFIARG